MLHRIWTFIPPTLKNMMLRILFLIALLKLLVSVSVVLVLCCLSALLRDRGLQHHMLVVLNDLTFVYQTVSHLNSRNLSW